MTDTVIRWAAPNAGRKVRYPGSAKVLAPEGASVPWTSYWQRLLNDGDIRIVEPPTAPAPAEPKSPRGKED